jgi:hypothetical protein
MTDPDLVSAQSAAGEPVPPESYTGSVELRSSDGHLLGLVHVTVPDLDAPVWSTESTEPIDLGDIDPGGETVVAQLADHAHARVGDVAVAHLQLRDGRLHLAGNYGFHAPDH